MSEDQPENALDIERSRESRTETPSPAEPEAQPQTTPVQSTPTSIPAQPVSWPAIRTRTVVFGLILLVVAACVLLAQLTDAHIDAGAVALGLMVVAGLLLIAGGRRTSG
jgi:hypothetical protein